MAHTQMDKRKASTSFRSQNTDGHMWWNVSVRERKPQSSELISMVELARFQKDEGPKEPWRPGYKGGAGRCVWGGESRRTGPKAIWGGAGPADLFRHPSGLLLLMTEFSQWLPLGHHHMTFQSPPQPWTEEDNQQHLSTVYSEKKKTEKYKQKENV